MNSELLDRTIIAIASDLSAEPIAGIVVGTTGNAFALRLLAPINLPNGEAASYLVASIRHENNRLSEIAAGQRVLCGITLVPTARFDPTQPCDLSWWRGGGAAIGDVAATPEYPPQSPREWKSF
jgi:hypothetical protein